MMFGPVKLLLSAALLLCVVGGSWQALLAVRDSPAVALLWAVESSASRRAAPPPTTVCDAIAETAPLLVRSSRGSLSYSRWKLHSKVNTPTVFCCDWCSDSIAPALFPEHNHIGTEDSAFCEAVAVAGDQDIMIYGWRDWPADSRGCRHEAFPGKQRLRYSKSTVNLHTKCPNNMLSVRLAAYPQLNRCRQGNLLEF